MGPGVVPNFVPFRQSPSRNFGMRNDVGTYHEERHFDVALLQNVKQPGGVADTWFRKIGRKFGRFVAVMVLIDVNLRIL
jgi:hypothetical protein